MKKKHIGFITLLLVLLLGYCSNTFAYTLSDYYEFIIYLKENNITDSRNTINVYNNVLSTITKFQNYANSHGFGDRDYTGIFWSYNSGYNTYEINVTTDEFTYYVDGKYTYTSPQISYNYFYNYWGDYYQSYTGYFKGGNDCAGLLVGEPTNGTYGTSILQNMWVRPPSLDLDLYDNGDITIYNDFSSDTFKKYLVSRSFVKWALGKLDLENGMSVDVRLNMFVSSDVTSTVGHAQWYSGNTTYSGGLSIEDDGVIYISNVNVYYNQGYLLTIDLDGENVYNIPVYFLPLGSTLTSGDLFNYEIDTNEYIGLLNNFRELVGIQNISSIYDENFSGDSGDVLLDTLNYSDYDNYYSNRISTMLMSLKETMLGSGDVAYTFNFMGDNMTVHSDDFYVPNGVLKFFVTSFLVFATIYYLYVQASHFFHKLQEGEFEAALDTYSVNDESILM